MVNEIMVNTYDGTDGSFKASAADQRYAIVVSRYNDTITRKLLDGATRTLQSGGVAEDRIDVAWVPGAWELPVVARHLLEDTRYAAVLCLGCVIRGETTHDQHINTQVSQSLGQLALTFKRPVLFGVLTCHSLAQAIQRSGGRVGNKGEECAHAALEMVALLNALSNDRPSNDRPSNDRPSNDLKGTH